MSASVNEARFFTITHNSPANTIARKSHRRIRELRIFFSLFITPWYYLRDCLLSMIHCARSRVISSLVNRSAAVLASRCFCAR